MWNEAAAFASSTCDIFRVTEMRAHVQERWCTVMPRKPRDRKKWKEVKQPGLLGCVCPRLVFSPRLAVFALSPTCHVVCEPGPIRIFADMLGIVEESKLDKNNDLLVTSLWACPISVVFKDISKWMLNLQFRVDISVCYYLGVDTATRTRRIWQRQKAVRQANGYHSRGFPP